MSGTLTLPESIPFESGPPRGFASWLGLIRAGDPRVMRRAVLAAGVEVFCGSTWRMHRAPPQGPIVQLAERDR
jgi:hypothetical protein